MNAPGLLLPSGRAGGSVPLRPAWLMLQAPWQWRRNEGRSGVQRAWNAAVALLLAGVVLVAVLWSPPRLSWPVLGLLSLFGVVSLFVVQFAALLRLDHPHAAHAVPGHRGAVRRAALGAWSMGVALYAAAAALAGGLLFGAATLAGLAAALAAGTVMLLVAAGYRWWWMWLPICALPTSMAIPGWSGAVVQAVAWALAHWQSHPLGWTLVVLVAEGLLLGGLFGQGDAAHARSYAARERLRLSFSAPGTPASSRLAALGPWGEWLGRPGQMLSDAWLNHVVRAANASPASVLARADVVLYRRQHLVHQFAIAGLAQAVLFVGIAAVVVGAGVPLETVMQHGSLGIAIGLTSMLLDQVVGLNRALGSSRRDQALLVLLPGMPQGVALNQALARRQLQHALMVGACTLPGFGLLAVFGAPPEVLAMPAVVLPLLAWLWRDWTREHRAAHTVALYACATLLAVLSWNLLHVRPDAWLPWLAALLGLSAGLLRWRWQRLATLPRALPTGRRV